MQVTGRQVTGRQVTGRQVTARQEIGSVTARRVERQCSRTGCSERATFTLTYHYARSHVWLDELSHERDPHAYDLCSRHADRLSVPAGWSLDDRRVVHAPLIAV